MVAEHGTTERRTTAAQHRTAAKPRMTAKHGVTAKRGATVKHRATVKCGATRRWRIRRCPSAAGIIQGCLALSWLLAPLLPEAADALPRYSARYGQSCILCHHNPTGGGLRSLYASQYLVPAEIATRAYQPDELARFNPSLTPNIFAGVDLRNVISEGEGEHGLSGNIAMQADLYLGLQMDERFAAYLDLGQSRTHEYFGLAHILPANGYIKVGRFTPAYGWRFADHQLAGRRYLLFAEGTDFASTLHDAGIDVDPALVMMGDFRQASGYDAARQLLQLDPPPTALFVANNLMMFGVMIALNEAGVRVPADVSVVGFDEVDWAQLVRPALTVVSQPAYEVGLDAADLLLRRINGDGDSRKQTLLLDPELVVRDSTAAPGGG